MVNYSKKYCIVSLLLVILNITVFASISDVWFSAASIGDTSAIQKLLDEKANINEKGTLNMTPLMVASMFGKADVVQQLLDAHAGINLQSGSGLTALMFASQKGHADVVKLLVDAGANKNLKSTSGTTALKYATEKGYVDIIALLKTPQDNKYVQPAPKLQKDADLPSSSQEAAMVEREQSTGNAGQQNKTAYVATPPQVQVQGVFSDGYIKYTYSVSVTYDDVWNGKPVKINYEIFVADEGHYMTRSEDGLSLKAENLELKVEGQITHISDGNTPKITPLSGIILTDNHEIVSSWLYSTKCYLKPTNMAKIRSTLKMGIHSGEKDEKLPSPIWLFKIQKDYSLKFQK
jgi:hypothetical protein